MKSSSLLPLVVLVALAAAVLGWTKEIHSLRKDAERNERAKEFNENAREVIKIVSRHL
jgi:hypothetical protein